MGITKKYAISGGGLRARFQIAKVFVLIAVSLLTTACPNNTGTEATAKNGSSGTGPISGGSKSFGGTTGADLPTGSSQTVITLKDAVRSNQDPNTLLELLASNDEIGLNCPTTKDCNCIYSWTESSGILREDEQTPDRVETNMMRCLFTKVPSEITSFNVRIRIISSNATSSTVKVTMPSQNPSLDASIASNYRSVQRYMCRDILLSASNTNLYQKTIIDPQLWDKSYTYNFFTTSLGLDYGATVSRTGQEPSGWECPLIPNDPSDSPWGGTPFYDYRVFSLDPVNINNPADTSIVAPSGDNTIYPNDDNLGINTGKCILGTEPECEKFILNRHDYYLATFQSGIFKEPVCLIHKVSNFISPTLNCTINKDKGAVVLGGAALKDGGQDIIGFAALPDGNQQCPDPNRVKIPAGKKWAKIWRFRASLAKRKVRDIFNQSAIGDLFCTTRNEECFTNKKYLDSANIEIENSVCVGAKPSKPKNPGKGKLGYQVSATPGGSTTTSGFGNCNPNGLAGNDGKGSDATGAYSNVNDPASSPLLPCTADASKILLPASWKADWVTAKDEVNCCTDLNAKNVSTGAAISNQVPANFTPGGWMCTPTLIGSHNAAQLGGVAEDVWLMGLNGGNRACIEADTDASGKLKLNGDPNPNPFDYEEKEVDAESRFDYLYVVTPASVTFESMNDPNNKISRQYTPYRQKPGSAGEIIKYSLDSGSQNTADSADRFSKFPLCVIQDAIKGVIPSGEPVQ